MTKLKHLQLKRHRPLMCGDCHDHKRGPAFMTEVNPKGRYGRPRLLVCDDCMKSGRWDDWKARVWPNWPEKRTA